MSKPDDTRRNVCHSREATLKKERLPCGPRCLKSTGECQFPHSRAPIHIVKNHQQITGYNGDIWTSTNGGVTWTDQTTGKAALSQRWVAVASNSTGTHVVAVGGGAVWAN